MKKVIISIASLVLCLGLSLPALAIDREIAAEDVFNIDTYSQEEYQEIIQQVPNFFTQEYQSKLESLLSKASPLAVIGYKTLSVTNYQQEDPNWCGPAVAKMIIKYVEGTTVSQSTLANKMGTNSSGTVLGTMCDVLNDDYITGDEYVPMALWQTGVVLANQIQYSINASNPVIAVCRTGVLPNYDKNINHYLCITGYDYSADISVYECKYNDPNWDDDYYGSYWTTVPTMKQAIENHQSWFAVAY